MPRALVHKQHLCGTTGVWLQALPLKSKSCAVHAAGFLPSSCRMRLIGRDVPFAHSMRCVAAASQAQSLAVKM